MFCLSEVREFHSTTLLMMIMGEQRGTGAGTGGRRTANTPRNNTRQDILSATVNNRNKEKTRPSKKYSMLMLLFSFY